MSLDTQTFGISRYWLSAALTKLPSQPELFASTSLCEARKAFLAGKNQVSAIKNWLVCADIVTVTSKQTALTDLGRLVAAQDPRAESAWTWWLFHLHLCANVDSFPYSTFFKEYDPEINSWSSFDEIVGKLNESQNGDGRVAEKTVKTYFEGVERTFRPTLPIYGLGLIERRSAPEESKKELIRRRCVEPRDLVVLYATMLFHQKFFANDSTVEAKQLIDRGLGRVLGIGISQVRSTFVRIHQDATLGQFLQYSQAANLDSLQFGKKGEEALKQIRSHTYVQGNVRWP
ncbi:MAG: DUF4007 family protein [Planctomycetaceae bacterium]|nr:DUF4007 family protein [Planctomycetaceae bacterium]